MATDCDLTDALRSLFTKLLLYDEQCNEAMLRESKANSADPIAVNACLLPNAACTKAYVAEKRPGIELKSPDFDANDVD